MIATDAQKAAFVHKPKKLDQAIYVGFSGPLFNAIWDKAKVQDWYQDGIGYVGNDKGVHYFQIAGYTGGFARIEL
jgi:hypothetical protein